MEKGTGVKAKVVARVVANADRIFDRLERDIMTILRDALRPARSRS